MEHPNPERYGGQRIFVVQRNEYVYLVSFVEDEHTVFESVERGEWKPAAGGRRERTRHARYAKATFRKDRRLNIRLSSKDLKEI